MSFGKAVVGKGIAVDVDLFIKKMPHVVKELIGREAADNRRSINQEAIALLEEALLQRVGSGSSTKRKQIEALLKGYADSGAAPLAPTPSTDAGLPGAAPPNAMA